MSVWDASFWIAQERLHYVFFIGLLAAAGGRLTDLLGKPGDLDALSGFVPPYLGINNPLYRLALALILLWILLSILFTVAARLRIRRENEVRPKR